MILNCKTSFFHSPTQIRSAIFDRFNEDSFPVSSIISDLFSIDTELPKKLNSIQDFDAHPVAYLKADQIQVDSLKKKIKLNKFRS